MAVAETVTCKRVRSAEAISPAMSAALDRSNVSDRKAAFIISEAAKTYGQDVNKMAISLSSIRRSRMMHREQHAKAVKSQLIEGPLVVHIDGKLLPAIDGKPEKEDRVAVVVTGINGEKLLGIPKIAQGTGEQIAAVTYTTLLEWDLHNQVAGISFDTTASNTGLSNGSCMLLEQKLQKELLWFACRHHVLELICGAAFKAVFGPTTAGPNVPLFRRFQEFWPAIDQTSYTSCSDKRLTENLKSMKANAILFASEALTKSFPREDYRELLELTLIFLGETPPRGVSFRSPGAFHHARSNNSVHL